VKNVSGSFWREEEVGLVSEGPHGSAAKNKVKVSKWLRVAKV